MASTNATAQSIGGVHAADMDELDDLFDYDIDNENDPFSENYKVPGNTEAPKAKPDSRKGGANLGIDEEIEVTRKPRAPRVKLDEHRLEVR